MFAAQAGSGPELLHLQGGGFERADGKHVVDFGSERRSEGLGRSDSAPEVGQGVWHGEDGQTGQGHGKGLCLFD
ncbi:TPA: hypothetical protein ACH3X1_010331 [Trebouxia sp. C0004]